MGETRKKENLPDLHDQGPLEDQLDKLKKVLEIDVKASGEQTQAEISFELLSDNNYDEWKINAKKYLKKLNLWKCIDESSLVSRSNTEKDGADTETKNKLLKLMGDSDMISDVKYCKTSREMWEKLEKICGLKKQARKGTLMEKLMNHPQLKDEGALEATLEGFFLILDKMISLDMKVEKNNLIIALLRILPPSFAIFKRSVISAEDWPEIGDLVREILEYASLSAEDRNPKDDPKEEQEFEESASGPKNVRENIVPENYGETQQQAEDFIGAELETIIRHQLKPQCAICGSDDHASVTCLTKIWKQTNVSASKRSYKCGICGEEGHNRTTCVKSPVRQSSSPPKRRITCGNCGVEGHNRTSCTQTSVREPEVKPPRKCGICGEAGHNSSTCLQKIRSESNSITVKRTVTCGLCGEPGHNRTTCSKNIASSSKTTGGLSSTPKRTIHCGLCGKEGHNRTTCSMNATYNNSFTSSTPKRTIHCGNCGGEGHNRTTCSYSSPVRSYSSPSYTSSNSYSAPRRSYTCGNCGGSGHNSRTCSR